MSGSRTGLHPSPLQFADYARDNELCCRHSNTLENTQRNLGSMARRDGTQRNGKHLREFLAVSIIKIGLVNLLIFILYYGTNIFGNVFQASRSRTAGVSNYLVDHHHFLFC
jgi:hypothetical protein